MRYLFTLAVLLAGVLPVFAQARLKATASPSRVEQLGYVEVTYEVDATEATDFEAPDFAPFRPVGGASRQSSTTIVNGRASYSLRISYTLLAEEAGRHEIPPATVAVAGKRVRSNALLIEVTPGTAPEGEPSGDEEVFAATVLSADTVYLGERVLISSELLNRVDIRTYSMLAPLDLTGLQADQLRRFGGYARRRRVDDREYQVTRLQVLDAYATRPGTFDLGTQALDVGVVQPGRRRSFFFGPSTESRRVVTAPVQLTVLPLPEGAPEDFSGAVGTWSFEGRFSGQREVSTADAVTFELTARGRGDVSRLSAPAFDWPTGWRALPPELLEDERFETDIGLTFRRTYRYELLPEAPGYFELAPAFSYFDVQTERYETWRAVPAKVTVTGETVSSRDVATASAPEALPLPTGEPRVIRGFWVTQAWYWGLFGAMGLAMAGAALGWVLRKRNRERPPAAVDPLAEGRARLAEAQRQVDDPAAFYAAVLEALERYGEDELGLGKSAQTAEGVRGAFAKTGRPGAAEGFLEARALADRGRYGGGVDREGREAALERLAAVMSGAQTIAT